MRPALGLVLGCCCCYWPVRLCLLGLWWWLYRSRGLRLGRGLVMTGLVALRLCERVCNTPLRARLQLQLQLQLQNWVCAQT